MYYWLWGLGKPDHAKALEPRKKIKKKKTKMYGWHVGRVRRNTVAIHVAGSAGPIGESVFGSRWGKVLENGGDERTD